MDVMTDSTSYAVSWRDTDLRFVGHARLLPEGLRLAGGGPEGREQVRTLRYEDVTNVDIVRLLSHRELALEFGDEVLMVSSLDRPGSLGELAERLLKLVDPPPR
jgi:hypothetical protein